jgi:hypothetical protein
VLAVAISCSWVSLTEVASPALAHEGGTMGIALTSGRLPAGAGVEIIGIDFSPEETIEVRLEGAGGRWMLGTLTAGPDGHFAVVLPVPPDVPPGLYNVDVVSTAGVTFRELLQVDPAAPMPAVTITPVADRIEPLDPGAADAADLVWQFAPLVILGAAFVGLSVIAIRRGRGAPGNPTG